MIAPKLVRTLNTLVLKAPRFMEVRRMVLHKHIITFVVLVLGLVLLGEQGSSVASCQKDSPKDLIVIILEIPRRGLLSEPGEKPYRVGDKPYIKMIAKNNSDQQIVVRIVDPYYQNRPRLFKNGELQPYRREIAELIRLKDAFPQFFSLSQEVVLNPYSSADLDELDLKEWYGVLEPGSYRLVNRYRPQLDGSWTAESAALLFQVVKQ